MGSTEDHYRIPTREEIEARIARFDKLEVLESQKASHLPVEVMDIIYSRELKPVLTGGEDPNAPFGDAAPIQGAAGASITYAVCPPGTGPSLHSHRATFETFTVMRGRFEFSCGPNGEETVELREFDTFSVPPGIFRAFRNISEVDGVLQVLISGGEHDARDVVFPKSTVDEIAAFDPAYVDWFRDKAGLRFE